jgi:thymidine phosphorylase
VVYDVKCGNGAFMKTREAAHHLAARLVDRRGASDAHPQALVTDMSQPLGRAACLTRRSASPSICCEARVRRMRGS